MKIVSLALLGLLAALHWLGGDAATARPLSMFRDGNYAWLGYLAFVLLILMAIIMARAAYRSGEWITGLFYTGAIVMLIAIAATPSCDSFHVFISLLLPAMFYVFYIVLLQSEASFWAFLHLFIPLCLLLAIQYHSFGGWQKCMIVYFGLVTNIHYQLLPHPVRKKSSKKFRKSTHSNWDRDDRRIAEGAVLKTVRTRRIDRAGHSRPM